MTFTILCLFGLLNSYGQHITGAWYGTLKISGNSLRLVFHITKNGDNFTSTMDSPDQGAAGLPTDRTQFSDQQLTIEAAKFGIKYAGTYRPDSSKITGTFSQGGANFPLVLTAEPSKAAQAVPAKRPQDPINFPYKNEEVTFSNDKAGNTLAGTLTLPAGNKFSKVVILVSGSGPQNRDEEVAQFNHRPFLVWSDWLTRKGIAVLRYDDRGVGRSTGDFGSATSADFADDAEAAITYLRSRPDMKGVQIGLLGHSEGGLIAPMVAARNSSVKFAVLLAGPGVPITDLMVQQGKDQLRSSGAPDSVIAISSASNAKMYEAMNRYSTLPAKEFKIKMDTLLYTMLHNTPKDALGGQSVEDIAARTMRQINTPWFRYFITYRPAVALQKVTCPVLALNGTLDTQVQSTANLAGIKAALIKGGNKRSEVLPLTGLNHLLQRAGTGAVSEYAQISETVNPLALEKVSTWIGQLK